MDVIAVVHFVFACDASVGELQMNDPSDLLARYYVGSAL